MSEQSPWNAGGFGPPPQLPPQTYPSGHYPAAPPPPAYAPYPPPVGGPPPRRSGPVLIIAGVVTAAVIAGLLIWTPWNSASGAPGDQASPSTLASSQDPARIAEASLREAAEALDSAQAVSYEGGFTDSDGKAADFALQTTHAGWSRGTLKSGTHTIRLLTAGENRLMKADKAYWKAQDYSDTTVSHFSGHWVDSAVELPDIGDLTTPLAPANLAALMRDAANRGHVTPGTETTLDGTRAQRLYTPEGRYYITVSAPHTLVRVESAASSSSSSSSSDSTGPLALPDGTDATVTELTGADRSGFTSAYKKDLGALTSAVDPDISFSTTGKPRFSPCGNFSCTAKFSLQNLVYDPLGAVSGDPVHAVITIDVKLDGHKVKTCVFHRTMKANGKVSLSCRATYSASRYSDHTVRGLPDAWARAVSDSELKKLKADFADGAAGTGGTGASA